MTDIRIIVPTALRAQPAPPVGDNATRINTALGGAVVPFAYNAPADPVTTQTINVTAGSYSSLLAAVQTDGAEVIVPAGTYVGQISNVGDDVNIIMDNAATVQGAVLMYGTNRVRWTGGNIDGDGGLFDADSNDLLFDNVRITNISSGYIQGTVNRYAMINCTVRSNTYAAACQNFNTDTDMIYINNDMEGGLGASQATFRLQSVHRAVIVGNRFWSGNSYVFRLHYNMESAYVYNNMTVSDFGDIALINLLTESGGSPNTYGPYQDITVDNNQFYATATPLNQFQEEAAFDGENGCSLTNNQSYWPSNVTSNWVTRGTVATESGNVRNLVSVVTPPTYTGGADH